MQVSGLDQARIGSDEQDNLFLSSGCIKSRRIMKIIITGSLGNVSKPLTSELVNQGHSVTVISTNPEKKKEVEALGATAAIGNLIDAQFLAKTFAGTDAVYGMESTLYSGRNFDLSCVEKLAHNYVRAIRQSGVKRMVNLGSIGAHTNKGNGALDFYFDIEAILKTLPAEVTSTFMRPVGFYGNLFRFIHMIKTQGVTHPTMAQTIKSPGFRPLISPLPSQKKSSLRRPAQKPDTWQATKLAAMRPRVFWVPPSGSLT